jgi:methyl-accepting chemotaxis protein
VQESFCSSLTTLESSLQALEALEPTAASKEDYDNAVSEVDDDWDQVKSDASDLADVTSDLGSAWEDFTSALDNVPDDASVSDAVSGVASAAQTFGSTVQATLTGPDCATS